MTWHEIVIVVSYINGNIYKCFKWMFILRSVPAEKVWTFRRIRQFHHNGRVSLTVQVMGCRLFGPKALLQLYWPVYVVYVELQLCQYADDFIVKGVLNLKLQCGHCNLDIWVNAFIYRMIRVRSGRGYQERPNLWQYCTHPLHIS